SAFLAGVKRSTGLTYVYQDPTIKATLSRFSIRKLILKRAQLILSPSLQSDKITENREIKRWIDKYLGVGEWFMDQSVAVLGSSAWFERKR
ncbi:MAG: hypothetical protein M1816_000572, partial [Peltula sp. TS41687]